MAGAKTNTAPRSTPSPSLFELSLGDWWRIIRESFREAGRDRLGLAAAGVAFYAFLALVPLLLAAMLIYGLVANAATVARDVATFATVLPQSAAELVRQQLDSMVRASGSSKGWGLALSLSVALFYASNGASAVINALGVAYDQDDRRGFLHLTIIALLLTLGGLLAGAVVVGAIVALNSLGHWIPGIGGSDALYQVIIWAVLLFAGMAATGVLYRFGPHDAEPRWRWFSAGAALASASWLVLALAFGLYVRTFHSFAATYGSLSAVIMMLTWLFLSAYVLLFGAEFNAVARKHKLRQR